jgi:hypothetical protein
MSKNKQQPDNGFHPKRVLVGVFVFLVLCLSLTWLISPAQADEALAPIEDVPALVAEDGADNIIAEAPEVSSDTEVADVEPVIPDQGGNCVVHLQDADVSTVYKVWSHLKAWGCFTTEFVFN